MLQHLGLISIILYWANVTGVLKHWGVFISKTLSDHVATGWQRRLYNPVAYLTSLTTGVFLVYYLLPKYDLPGLAYFFTILAIGAHMLVIAIPRVKPRINLHDQLATIVGTSSLILVGTYAMSPSVPVLGRWLAAFMLIVMIGNGLMIVDRTRKYFLVYQVVFYTSFQLTSVILAYL